MENEFQNGKREGGEGSRGEKKRKDLGAPPNDYIFIIACLCWPRGGKRKEKKEGFQRRGERVVRPKSLSY